MVRTYVNTSNFEITRERDRERVDGASRFWGSNVESRCVGRKLPPPGWPEEVVGSKTPVTVNLRNGWSSGSFMFLYQLPRVWYTESLPAAFLFLPPDSSLSFSFSVSFLVCRSRSLFFSFFSFSLSLFLIQSISFPTIPGTVVRRRIVNHRASFFHVFALKLGHLDTHTYRYVCCSPRSSIFSRRMILSPCGCASVRS